MAGGSKDSSLMKRLAEHVFIASLLIFGAVIILNLAIDYLRLILPWLVGGVAVAAAVWVIVAIVRWRRSRW